jgi:acyl-CoA synthetase (AMP-forming)/AMP-acid ligase II
VAGGYHGRPEATAVAFGGNLTDGRGPYLRSGDLGVLLDGELHVTGRLKDVVIVQGRTLDAHDVETAVRQAITVDPQGMTAALSTTDGGHERFVVAHEVGRHLERPPEQVVQDVQAAVAARFDVRADEVVLLRIGALPRTTSGKLRRSEAARMLVDGELAGLP